MSWLALAVLCCLATEIFVRLPILAAARRITAIGLVASRMILSRRISEHWKERAAGAYALRMGRGTAVLSCWMLFFAALTMLLAALLDMFVPELSGLLITAPGVVLSIAVSVLYAVARRRLGKMS